MGKRSSWIIKTIKFSFPTHSWNLNSKTYFIAWAFIGMTRQLISKNRRLNFHRAALKHAMQWNMWVESWLKTFFFQLHFCPFMCFDTLRKGDSKELCLSPTCYRIIDEVVIGWTKQNESFQLLVVSSCSENICSTGNKNNKCTQWKNIFEWKIEFEK